MHHRNQPLNAQVHREFLQISFPLCWQREVTSLDGALVWYSTAGTTHFCNSSKVEESWNEGLASGGSGEHTEFWHTSVRRLEISRTGKAWDESEILTILHFHLTALSQFPLILLQQSLQIKEAPRHRPSFLFHVNSKIQICDQDQPWTDITAKISVFKSANQKTEYENFTYLSQVTIGSYRRCNF